MTSAAYGTSRTANAGAGPSAPVSRRESRVALAAGLGLAFFYFILRSRNHPVDAVLYALAVEVRDAYPFFHWHHLLYVPLNWLFFAAARLLLGYAGDAFTPMAAVSAAFGGGAATLFYLALRRIGAARPAAAVATAAAALSAGWWYFAGEAEVLAGISFFLAGALWLLAATSYGWGRAALVGCWLGVGTLFHQTVFLFVPLAALMFLWKVRKPFRVIFFLAVYAAVVVPAYVLIPRLYYGVSGAGGWFEWVTYYARWGDWAHFSGMRFARALPSLLAAVAAGPDPYDVGRRLSAGTLASRYGPAVFFLGAALAAVVAGGRRLWRERRPWLVLAAAWFVLYQVFFSWWEPENVEWWIATTMPVWLLVGLALPRRRWLSGAAAVGVLALATLNFIRLIYPATVAGRNDAEAAARAMVAASRRGDVILISHVDTWAWTDYVSRHTLTLMLPFNNPDVAALRNVEAAARDGFRDFSGRRRDVYFTDYEWDEPALAASPLQRDYEATFFRMIRPAAPVALIRFPGRQAPFVRFSGYDETLADVGVYHPAGAPSSGEDVILSGTGDTASFKVDLPSDGTWTFAVQAYGRRAGGEWPTMKVRLDGWDAGTVSVDAGWRRFYELKANLKAGVHDLDAVFTNDFYDKDSEQNRDLWVCRLVVYRRI